MLELNIVALAILAYISGAIPWSVWIGKKFANIDPRTASDGNPGAANAFRTIGWKIGTLVLILDFLKAFIPVAIARWALDLQAEQLFWIALAPSVGHSFSIFLLFRGGRGLTTMFGAWTGLTLSEVPVVMGITAILSTLFIPNDELKTLAIPVVTVIYLLLREMPDWMVALAIAQMIILLLKIIPHWLRPVRQAQDEIREGES